MPAFLENVSLKPFNTFGLDARAAHFARCTDSAEVAQAVAFSLERGLKRLVLGGGSNILLTGDFEGLVLRIETRGIELLATEPSAHVVRVSAGENWHGFVMHALAQGWNGLENLALVPGTVGAAPVQNIGAYGVELDSLVDSLRALDVQNDALVTLRRADCGFAYRDSIFKRGALGRYVILDVTFRLPRGRPPETGYADVRKWLKAHAIAAPAAGDVANAVIAIRREKLPDPAQIGNAGSFFKNPLVSGEQFARLALAFPGIVGYPQPDGSVKLAAGWLIDRAGWKGRQIGGAAVYKRQALVLVNRGNATPADVIALARAIQADVQARYGIELDRTGMDMNSAKSVAESLRDATHEVHRSLERLPLAVSLAEGSISTASYRLYLQRLLVVVREIDRQLADPRHAQAGVREWSDGLRERWICEDLAALGGAVPAADPGVSGGTVGAAAIWGQLYVIEGSTLGGVVLARGLAAREELRPALRYLNGYGAGTGERWRRFRAALAAHVPAAGLPEAIDAARDMFSRFGTEVMA